MPFLTHNFPPQAVEDFWDRKDTQTGALVTNYVAQAGPHRRVTWPYIRAARLVRIWLDYGKTGVLRDEKGMATIAHQALNLIARLYAATEISGHVSYNVRPEVEELFGARLTDGEWDDFLGALVDADGRDFLSDYAFQWLMPLYVKLYTADTAEAQLHIVDRILNVVHQRSDLSRFFVEGGQHTLHVIATQGGYQTPDQQIDQPWRRTA